MWIYRACSHRRSRPMLPALAEIVSNVVGLQLAPDTTAAVLGAVLAPLLRSGPDVDPASEDPTKIRRKRAGRPRLKLRGAVHRRRKKFKRRVSRSLLKKVFEVSLWATLIQDPSARRTKDSQPSGFGFEYCASHVRFRVFQQTARSDLVDFRLGLGRRFAGQPRRFCSHRSIDDRHRAAQAWHSVVRCHHAAPRLALFGLGTL